MLEAGAKSEGEVTELANTLDIPYLSDLINYHKYIKNSEWKIQLNIGVNFISVNDTGEIRTLYVNSDNEQIRLGNETYGIINRLVESFLSKYQKEEKILRNGSNFIFETVNLLNYHIHKIEKYSKKSKIIYKISWMDIK